jgi:DNA-binding MarR family transcriptional regulator
VPLLHSLLVEAEVRSLLHLLHRASQRADLLFAREVAGAGLTPRQFAVLDAVSNEEGLTQSGIMDATGIDRSSTSELVRRLVRNGALQRRRRDARSYAVRLTPKGRQLLTAGVPAARAAGAALLSMIPQGQRSTFIKTLEHIALTEDDDTPGPSTGHSL